MEGKENVVLIGSLVVDDVFSLLSFSRKISFSNDRSPNVLNSSELVVSYPFGKMLTLLALTVDCVIGSELFIGVVELELIVDTDVKSLLKDICCMKNIDITQIEI